MRFKNRIAEYRKKFNLTQKELAFTVGVSKNAISSFERYEYCPSAFTAKLLCICFNCTFEELFYLEKVEVI